jgi:hypothetical protein
VTWCKPVMLCMVMMSWRRLLDGEERTRAPASGAFASRIVAASSACAHCYEKASTYGIAHSSLLGWHGGPFPYQCRR